MPRRDDERERLRKVAAVLSRYELFPNATADANIIPNIPLGNVNYHLDPLERLPTDENNSETDSKKQITLKMQ